MHPPTYIHTRPHTHTHTHTLTHTYTHTHTLNRMWSYPALNPARKNKDSNYSRLKKKLMSGNINV